MVEIILYIYSMETILPQAIERASKLKDESALPTLGPYVLVLVHILSGANRGRKGLRIKPNSQFLGYKGVRRTTAQVMRYEAGKFLDIKGFCSVHQSKEMAIQASMAADEEQDNDQLMMLVDQEGPLQSVIFLITFTDLWAHFELNSS